METSDLHPDHRELIELFISHHVDFIVVGSYALAFHGYVRFTQDIDFWVQRSEENATKIREAFKEFGIPIGEDAVHLLTQDRQLLQIGIKPQMVDLLTFLDGCDYETASTRAKSESLSGLEVRILSIDDYIATKIASARPKDFDDLRRLGEILNRNLLPGE